MLGSHCSSERCMNIVLGNAVANERLNTQNMRSALSCDCIASCVRALSNTSDVTTNDVIVASLAHVGEIVIGIGKSGVHIFMKLSLF